MKRLIVFAICMLADTAAFAQKVPKAKSRAEAQAYMTMMQAQDPDSRIKAADEFLSKYANTEFKSIALYVEADAYQQKGDNVKAQTFAEQALDADPKNYDAEVMLSNIVAGTTHENDLDKDAKIARVKKMANDVIDGMKTATTKPNPQMTDEQWTRYKNGVQGQAYQALGTAALAEKKPEEAIKDFETGVQLDPDPFMMIRAGRALLADKKPDEAITWFDKALNSPDANAQVKSIATSDKSRAEKMKAAAPKQ